MKVREKDISEEDIDRVFINIEKGKEKFKVVLDANIIVSGGKQRVLPLKGRKV